MEFLSIEEDRKIFQSEGICGGHVCPNCKICMKACRKRKTFVPTCWFLCNACEIKDDFTRAFHKMNEKLDTHERSSVNKWHGEIWAIGDKLRDFTRTPSTSKQYFDLGENLMDLISKLPWLEK